jgi:hypothetical protein
MRPRDWLLTAAVLGWFLVAHGVVIESVWLSRAGMLLALGSMVWLAVRGRRAPADPGREDRDTYLVLAGAIILLGLIGLLAR